MKKKSHLALISVMLLVLFLITSSAGGVSANVDPPENLLDTFPSDEVIDELIVDTTPPQFGSEGVLTVTNLDATSITLEWSTAEDDVGVIGYKLFQDGAEVATLEEGQTGYTVTELTENTVYLFKVEAGDGAGNWSTDGPEITITTLAAPDTKLPETSASAPSVWAEGYPVATDITDQGLTLLLQSTEERTAYYLILEGEAQAPSIEQIKAGQKSNGEQLPDKRAGFISLPAHTEIKVDISDLNSDTFYSIFVVACDTDGNLQELPVCLEVSTLEMEEEKEEIYDEDVTEEIVAEEIIEEEIAIEDETEVTALEDTLPLDIQALDLQAMMENANMANVNDAGAPEIEWLKIISAEGKLSKSSEPNSNDKVCILNSLDGGYYLVGNCDQGIYILKTDAEGKVLAKYIKEPDAQQRIETYAATLCSDGSIAIVASKVKLVVEGSLEMLLLKVKFNKDQESEDFIVDQNSIIEKTFPSSTDPLNDSYNDRVGKSIVQTSDGGYIIAGCAARTFTEAELDNSPWSRQIVRNSKYCQLFYLMKVDSQFNLMWEKVYFDNFMSDNVARSFDSKARSVKQVSEGGFIVLGDAGYYYPPHNGDNYPKSGDCLFKVSEAGDLIWAEFLEQYNGPYIATAPETVLETKDGDFVSTIFKDLSYAEFYGGLYKVDKNGNKLWEKYYAPENGRWIPEALLETDDGGYIVAGSIYYGIPIWKRNSRIIKVSKSGTLIWECYGLGDQFGDVENNAHSMVLTEDGGIIVGGYLQTPEKTKPPEALLAGGIVPADTEVTFTSDTSGADIYYTTDGTDPNVNSQKGNSVTINGTPGEVVTVKALAVKDGMMESDIATFTYTIAKPSDPNKVAAPTATIAGGIVQDETEITLNSDTDGAVIYYTLDGTEPNEKSFSGSYAAIRGTPGEIVTLKAFAAKDGMIASDIATFTYTIEAPQDEVSEYSPYLLKLRPPLNVNVSVVYNSQNKTVDIKASAYCSQCGGILDRTNTTTAVYQIVDEGGNPLELDISGDLGWNQENEQWEALNVNLSQVISQAAAVVVTFEDNNQHRATAQGEIYAGNAKLGLSTYNVIPGGNVFVYAAFTDLEGENAPRKGDLSVRFEGGRDKFVLSDNGEFGDLVPEDGIYSSEFSILGKGFVEIELYLGNTLVDSKIINVIDKPELAVITDFDALYAEFKDTGMQDGEDIDGNGTGDYYDLLECLAQYAEAHKGVVFNLDQEISKNNGYKYDYDALTHAARYTKAREIDTFIKNISPGESIKNIAIIGDDEVVPFARRLDPTYNIDGDNKYWEQEYYDDMRGGGDNPTILDSQKGYIMTDVPYGSYSDHNPDYSTRPHLDAGVGRVFADRPLQLKNIILGYQEPIRLTNAAVFQMEEDTIDWLNSANNTLQPVLNANFKIGFVNDSSNPGFETGKYYSYDRVNYPAGWTPADVTTALQNVCLNMLWTHCDHLRALTRKDGPLKADHLRSMIESPGHVLISTGCHSGYSISHDSPKGNYDYYNNSLVKSIIEKQISYIAPTVYGIGFKDYVGYHDLMMQRFLENLLDTSTSTVGEAQVKAYREYWQRIQPNFAGYFNVYAAYGTCYYGLPTQPIDHIGSGFRTTAANSKLATFTAEASSVPSKIVLEPEFKVSELADGKTLFEAQAEGSFNLQAFAPVMPLITRKIKLPADTIIREIDLAAFSASEYQEEVILPTAIPVHKSRGALEGSYELPGTYPETIYWWDTYDDGTGLELVLSVIPMQYNKDSKKVTLYDRLEFEIITEANEVWAWGSNYHGQIGDGTKDDKTVPTKIGSDGWTAVAAGGSRTLAIKGDGSLWLWGDDGSGMEKTIPSQIGKDKDWATVTAGPFHIFALKKNGSLWIWNSSQLDDGTPRVPTQIGEDYDWILAAAGESHFAALKEDGSLWTWGSNYDGQLGDGTKENKVVPTMLDGDKDWVAVATGSNHTLAIKSDGSLWSWGNNFNGQLGTGDKEYSSSPRRVGTENNWAKVFANDMRSFALKTDGSLWAWGGNVGTDPILTPTQIGTEDGWKTVAPGDRHVVALKLDGSLWVWGENYAGQLGDGTTEDKLIPTLISNDLAWIGIAAGSDHSVAIKDRSTVLSDDVATVAIDKAALTWNVIKGANATQNSVTTNLNLITSGANGTTISWSINPDEGLINTATGAVTRPSNSQGDKTVTLTAIISKGEFSQTKQFVLTITALSKGNPEDPGDNGSEPRGDGPGSSKKDRVNENKAVAYDENSLNEAFEKATPDADGKKMISIELTQVPNTQLFRNEFPASVFTSENGDRLIKLTSDVGTIVLPCNMLAGTELESKDNITISISKAEKANLSQEMQNIIGDRPIIDLNISQGNQKLTWYNPSSPVTVSVPYTPTPEELANPEHIVVWYINEEGNAVAVPNGRYNTDTGMVTFTTTHFSQFAIAYVHKTFKDLDRVPWAKKAIEVMASKGIISGTGENIYSPTANITRADYLVLLVKTMGLSADFDNNFDDVEASAYYYQAIGIAKKLGIAAGDENNRFNPRENISRQDMMVLTAKALEKKGLVDSEVSASLLNRFNDQRDIAQYAVQSAATLLKEGLIAGDGGKLRPRTQTTRAEAAAFLYNIYNRYE